MPVNGKTAERKSCKEKKKKASESKSWKYQNGNGNEIIVEIKKKSKKIGNWVMKGISWWNECLLKTFSVLRGIRLLYCVNSHE